MAATQYGPFRPTRIKLSYLYTCGLIILFQFIRTQLRPNFLFTGSVTTTTKSKDITDEDGCSHVDKMKSQIVPGSALFAVLTRDNAESWGTARCALKRIGSAFEGGWSLLAIENDSKDNTKSFLTDWRKKLEETPSGSHPGTTINRMPRHLYILENISDHRGKGGRTQHGIKYMAYLRNHYLNFHVFPNGSAAKPTDISSRNILEKYEYLVVVDVDMKSYGEAAVIEALKIGGLPQKDQSGVHQIPWAALSANGIHWKDKTYYDVFAFRSEAFPWPDERGSTGSRRDGIELGCVVQSKPIDPGSAPFEIHSGFGGLTIYNTKFILPSRDNETTCSYASIEDNCEHVPFNYCVRRRAMRECAPFLLVPSMVVENKNEASRCPLQLEEWSARPWPAQCAATACEEAFSGFRKQSIFGTAVSYTETTEAPWKFDDNAPLWCKWSPDANTKPRPWLARLTGGRGLSTLRGG
eukprot:m.1565876 g.1565876  ORF g.1565876 m.1565876 type:complete len:467 (+) comp25288_c1_seq19:128-1528(+)